MTKKSIIIILALCIPFFIAELVLRMQGVTPGYLWELPWDVSNEQNLKPLDYWIVDSTGINKFQPDIANNLIASYDTARKEAMNNIILSYLILSHKHLTPKLQNDTNPSTESFLQHFTHGYRSSFEEMVTSMKNGTMPIRDSVDLAYVHLMDMPFNSDGFYSIPFQSYSTSKKKILVVGDSFTFGYSAIPSFNSFAALLATKGYAVYNAGIPGTDPAQHAAIVKRYIEQIKPDMVVFGFQPGHIMRQDRPLKPYTGFLHYVAGTEFVKGWFDGKYFDSVQDACAYYKEKSRIPGSDKNIFLKILSQSALGTKFYTRFLAPKDIDHTQLPQRLDFWEDSLSYSEKYLLETDSVCKANNASFHIVWFPNFYDLENQVLNSPPFVFQRIKYDSIPGIAATDYYTHDDNHFNNSGHKKVAELIDSIFIQENR